MGQSTIIISSLSSMIIDYLHQQRGWSKDQRCWDSSGSTRKSKGFGWSSARGESPTRSRGFSCQACMHRCRRPSRRSPSCYPPRSPMTDTCRLPPRFSSPASRARTACPWTTPRTRTTHGPDFRMQFPLTNTILFQRYKRIKKHEKKRVQNKYLIVLAIKDNIFHNVFISTSM